MTAASCRPSKYLSSFSVANASISGNSVVPGLPNMISTPSCLSRSRKARFPDMTGKNSSQCWGGKQDGMGRVGRWERSAVEQVLAAAVGGVVGHDAIVKPARLPHQRIDVLRQQKAFADHGGGCRAHLLLIGRTVGVARRERGARIAPGLPLRLRARERQKRAVPTAGGPGEADSLAAGVEAGAGT